MNVGFCTYVQKPSNQSILLHDFREFTILPFCPSMHRSILRDSENGNSMGGNEMRRNVPCIPRVPRARFHALPLVLLPVLQHPSAVPLFLTVFNCPRLRVVVSCRGLSYPLVLEAGIFHYYFHYCYWAHGVLDAPLLQWWEGVHRAVLGVKGDCYCFRSNQEGHLRNWCSLLRCTVRDT